MSRTANDLHHHEGEGGFGVLLIVALPVFLVLVIIGRLFGTCRSFEESSVTSNGQRPGLIREAIEWARSTIAVSFQD